MTEEQVRTLLKKAARTNARRDVMDLSHGFAPPSDCPPDITVRTAISALEAGLRMDDWDCIAEATVMLGDLVDFHPWKA